MWLTLNGSLNGLGIDMSEAEKKTIIFVKIYSVKNMNKNIGDNGLEIVSCNLITLQKTKLASSSTKSLNDVVQCSVIEQYTGNVEQLDESFSHFHQIDQDK